MQNPHLEGGSFFWPAGTTGVLLIHGFTATTAEVRPLGRRLLAAGYTVSGPLLPGHGTTPEDANRYSWRDYTATVAEAFQAIKKHCSTVFIGGESMGGLLALYQAFESPEIPGLLLYAPAIQLATARAARLGPLLSPFLPSIEKPQGSLTAADSLWQGYTVYPLKAFRQLLSLQKMVRCRLAEINQPLLLVQGRLDRSVHPHGPGYILERVNSKIKELHWIDQSGHCVVLDCQRQEVETLTLEFLHRLNSA